MKYTKTYTSCMHVHVRYYLYEPKVILRIKGVIQIHHGLGEHADLYDHFAAFLLNQGFVVVVSDFAGHGKSLIDFEQGYFGAENGPDNLVKDMHRLQNIIRQQYPDVPYFLLGTDLGSVLIRKYVTHYGDFVDGILLLGTSAVLEHRHLKRGYLRLMKAWHGPLYKTTSHFYGSKHKKTYQNRNDIDWLTSDEEEKKKILNDPMTHFSYTIQGYRDIVHVMQEVNNEDSIAKTPPHLAVYIALGELDPMCKKINILVEKYKKAGIQDLTVECFQGMRHAVLFEKEKKDVYLHILNWLEERTFL